MRALLRSRRYLAFWLGQVTSTVGNQLTVVVLAALVVPDRGPGTFGLLLAVESAVMGVLLLAGGVVADRYSRSFVMAVADVLRLAGIVGFFFFASQGPLALLLVAAAITGAGAALYEPAHRAALTQVVPEDLRQQAYALDVSTKRVGSMAGALLAGIMLAGISPPKTLLVDVATFVVSLVTLVWLRLPPVRTAGDSQTDEPGGLRGVLAEAREGLVEVRRRPWVSVLMLQGTVQVFFLFGPNYILVPMVSQARYGISAFGWVSAATLAGSVIGSLLGGRVSSGRPGLWAMNALAPCLLTPVCLAVDVPLWMFCAAGAAGSAGVGCFMVLWYSSLQREFPEQVQGRVFALEGLASFGLQPIALAVTPLLVQFIGVVPFATLAAVVLLVSTYGALAVPGTAQFATRTRTRKSSAVVESTVGN
ncbi:MFS transporter [Streptomyces sp. NBC_00053]|nr:MULTISPECIES: MFS transporter [unclassified Streptomyces]MCX5161389.1 MFS transporter [Streptomyces sp. NBC_00305]MCX5219912.1 MFS transporter [Streptomyces sp. NBC_00264]WSG51925.1 MFS transporter [Streptomyces sp. NBC_01732]WSX02581.1 MFS transporter [Streptomyces sp. NBC_00987]MCX4395499.1 MFS transporter [Streptomyces sp. NBC_01767]